MKEFKEKRVWLVKMQSRLTATNAFMIDNSFITRVKEILVKNDGYIERKDIGRKRYFLIFSEADVLEKCINELKYISKYRDVTEQIIEGDYDKIVKRFDVEKFYRLYEAYYLEKCPVEYAKSRIKNIGEKSRYINQKFYL